MNLRDLDLPGTSLASMSKKGKTRGATTDRALAKLGARWSDMRPGERAGWGWWVIMLGISIGNIALLTCVSRDNWQSVAVGADKDAAQRDRVWSRRCAVLFTFVCAYRAIFPRVDVPRLCFFDNPLSWVIFGRVAAMLAEVGWAIQMGITVRRLGTGLDGLGRLRSAGFACAWRAGAAVVVLAIVAEGFSWTNLITKNNLWAVVEQALWAAIFLTVGTLSAWMASKWVGGPRSGYFVFAAFALVTGVEQAYEAFFLYLGRYHRDQSNGVQYQTSVWEGLGNLAECAETSQSIYKWQDDAPWMIAYFSIGVWSSIWMSLAPWPAATEFAPLADAARGLLSESFHF